jgi:integrase
VNAGGQIKTAFRGACRRAGIEDFSPHDCRHTWATWHYAANRDLVALMKLGGWKSERMALRYAHMNVSQHAALAEWGPKSAPGPSAVGQKLRRVK